MDCGKLCACGLAFGDRAAKNVTYPSRVERVAIMLIEEIVDRSLREAAPGF